MITSLLLALALVTQTPGHPDRAFDPAEQKASTDALIAKNNARNAASAAKFKAERDAFVAKQKAINPNYGKSDYNDPTRNWIYQDPVPAAKAQAEQALKAAQRNPDARRNAISAQLKVERLSRFDPDAMKVWMKLTGGCDIPTEPGDEWRYLYQEMVNADNHTNPRRQGVARDARGMYGEIWKNHRTNLGRDMFRPWIREEITKHIKPQDQLIIDEAKVEVVKQEDAASPLAPVIQDVRTFSRRIFARYNELCDLRGNGLRFDSRFQEIQTELNALRGTTVTWPATVTKINGEGDYEPGVHIGAHIPWDNSGGLNVHFVPADQHGDEYLLYSTHISKQYAGSLKVGDVIRIRGTINQSLFPNPSGRHPYSGPSHGYYRQNAFDYHISLANTRVVEPGAAVVSDTPPELIDINAMERLALAMQREIDAAGTNDIRLQQTLSEVQSQLHAYVGSTVTWLWRVDKIEQTPAARLILFPSNPGGALHETRLEQNNPPFASYGYLRIGTDISGEYAARLSRGDAIKIRGTITACGLGARNIIIIRIGSAVAADDPALAAPILAQPPQNTTRPTDAERDAKMVETTRKIQALENDLKTVQIQWQNMALRCRCVIQCFDLYRTYKEELSYTTEPPRFQLLKDNMKKTEAIIKWLSGK